MFNSKIYVLTTLFFISFSCNAGSSVWKQSHDLEKKGDFEKAALVIKPWATSNDEYALLRYAHLKYMQGEYNESIEYYKKAIKLNPKSLSAKLGLTLPYIAQGRWRQVIIPTRQVILRSDWNSTAHEYLMMAEEGEAKWHTLGRHAAELTKIYPADSSAYLYLARAKARFGNNEQAKDAYEEVLHRVPSDAEAEAFLSDYK